MANEYQLSYTAQEIDEKLSKIDNVVLTVNGEVPDENGNVQIEAGGAVEDAVLYTEQTLTPEQQAQARENIGAAAKTFTESMSIHLTDEEVVENHLVNNTGAEVYTDAWNCSSMIPLSFDAGEQITVKCSILGIGALVFYNENGDVIEAIDGNNAADYGITPEVAIQELSVTPPNDAKYIRMSALKAAYSAPSDFVVSGPVTVDTIETIKDIDKRTELLNTQTETVSVSISENDIIDGSFVYSSGSVLNANAFNCTEMIPLEFDENTPVTLRCTIYGNAALAFYNANGRFVSSITSENAADYGIVAGTAMQEFSVMPPYDAKYVRMSAWKEAYSAPSDFVVKGQVTTNIGTKVRDLEQTIKANATDFRNLKVLVLGDSISTDYYGNYTKWVTHLIESGFFSEKNTNNDSIHATGFVARLNDTANDFISRIEAVADPETYDLVIIFGGINDFIQKIPFGDSGGDKATYFKPAVDYFFGYLIENFTQARIAVLSPLRTSNTHATGDGKYQTDYADYIKTVARSYCIPVLNLTDESGFCPWITSFKNRWTLTEWIGGDGMTGDGVHPNEEYERYFLAPMIRHFIQGLM